MELQALNNSICDFYREISLFDSFEKIHYFQDTELIMLNATVFESPEIYDNIKDILNN